MKRILERLKEKLVRKGFWLATSQAKQVEKEAKKNWGNNESALMRHIITNWFES